MPGDSDDLNEQAPELGPSPAAAHDDERDPFGTALRVALAFGGLEGDEDPAPDPSFLAIED